MIVVTAYTPDYRRPAAVLQASCRRLNLECVAVPYADRGSWQKNCAAKPAIILDTLIRRRVPVLWVDADAVIWERPQWIESNIERADIVTARGERDELLSGTFGACPTPAAIDLIETWRAKAETSDQWDQRVLHQVIAASSGIVELVMPESCCYIYDWAKDKHPATPIIEHFQASRETRCA